MYRVWGERKEVHKIVLVGKPEGKNFGRRRGRWDDNIKMLV